MLKQRYKVFLLLFISVCIIGACLSKMTPYTYDTVPVGSHAFSLSIEEADNTVAPVCFSFANSTAVLHVAENFAKNLDSVSFRYPYQDTGSAPLDGFTYSDAMNGTLFVQTSSEDGTVLATAKSSTLNTQGYDSFAWDSHVFGTEDIPLEICYGGSKTMSTRATLLYWGQPYNGVVLLHSGTGKDNAVTIANGEIIGLTIHDLRKGISATVVEEETGRTLVTSYVAEEYTLFSDYNLGCFQSLALLILLTTGGCVLVALTRKIIQTDETIPFC